MLVDKGTEKIGGKSRRPDAFHVGFSKCASTFLQAYFEEHPDIFLVNQSHYLAPFSLSSYPEGIESYLQLFGSAATDQLNLESDEHILLPLFHPVLGAAATTLESVQEVSTRIKAIQPEAKIIVVVRNQTSLIVSRYSEYVICGGNRDFDDFVTEFLQCSQDGVNYYQNYYAAILKIFQADFSPGGVLLLLQEELAQDEPATIERLSTFLAIEPRRPGQRGIITRRVGLSRLGIVAMRAFNRLIVKRPKQSFHEAQVRIPFLLYKVMQRGLRLLDYYLLKKIRGDKTSIVSAATAARIRQEFRQDNELLGEMLGKNLSVFGY